MRIKGNKPLVSKRQLQGLINHLFTLFDLQSLQLSFWKKIYTFLTSDWLRSFFMQCWERLILHGFLLWSWTLTLCYYCYYYYYYYYYYNYVNYSGMVWWCCLYTVKRHELRIWALYTGKWSYYYYYFYHHYYYCNFLKITVRRWITL